MLLPCEKFVCIFTVFLLVGGTRTTSTGVKYFLATCPGQNCNSVCATFGFQCAKTGQSFPASSALPIFESLGISCKTIHGTEQYQHEEQPCYFAESHVTEWVGVCIGFKSIPETIDCHTANNTYIRRLCPCHDPTATLSPNISSKPPSTTKPPTTNRAAPSTADNKDHPEANPSDQQTGASGDADRTALIVLAIIAAVLVLCLLGLVVLFMRNKRKFISQKGDTDVYNEKLNVKFSNNKNDAVVSDMMDGLAVENKADEETSYCEMRPADFSLQNTNLKTDSEKKESSRYVSLTEKSTDNIIYASLTEEKSILCVSGNNNHVYDSKTIAGLNSAVARNETDGPNFTPGN